MKEIVVIIPTLNEEKFILGCLDSIMAQSCPNELMDICVVDGGSSDQTVAIVEHYSVAHPSVRVLNNPKRVQSVAFNIGVEHSTAPYIVRLDAHANYHREYIERCVEHLKNMPEVGNAGGMCDIQPQRKGLVPESVALLNQLSFGIGGAAFRVGAEAGYVDTVPFGAFPRSVVDKIGGMREDLPRGEDNEYNSRIQKSGYKIYFDPKIECTYFARGSVKTHLKQMYANGVSIACLMFIDRAAVGLRHLVPMFFFLFLVLGAGAAFITPYLCYAYLGVLGLYMLINILATISASIKHGAKFIVMLPFLFLATHFVYGLGTVCGFFKRLFS